jgi:ATP-dependent DNA helicase RecG
MAYPLFHELGPADVPLLLSTTEFRETFPGEDDHVEFKQGVSEDKIREAVAAFSNTDGGVILLGVRHDGAVQGLAADGELAARLHRVVAGVRNPGRYEVTPLAVGDRTVLVLSVARRREGFAQLADGRILQRRGAMNTPLFDTDLARFISARALVRFEDTPVAATLDDADGRAVERLRAAHGWSGASLAARLAEAGLLEHPADGARLTVAGTLFLVPRPADLLGKAYIEIFRFRADDDTYDRRLELDGPADEQVERATRELSAELGADIVVLGVRRHELPRIPEPVLREAIANAVAHRTYESSGQSIRIEVRPDRVVIRSPGGLPEPVTLDNIREQNAARNLHVIRALRRYRLAEDAGMGIDVMQDTMDGALLERPVFDAGAQHVTVTLRIGSTVAAQERAWVSELETGGALEPRDKLLLVHAARGTVLTNATVRDLIGVDSTHARSALQRLRDLGLLAQSGQRGGASYVLAAELSPPAGLGLDPTQLRAVVTAIATQEARVTNEAVRARTGLDRVHALALLTAMVEAGQLVRHGSRRGTYYTAPS